MNTYITELLIHFLYTIIFALTVFLLLGIIYFLTKENDTTLTEFLHKNKVYLDIIFIVALTFMSISIATNANTIATAANQIAENQLQIEKDANQPIFTFQPMTYDNGSTHKIIISNEGTQYNGIIDISDMVYLVVISYDTGHVVKVRIPINNYYCSEHVIYEENTNKLYEVSNSGNLAARSSLLIELEKRFTNLGWEEYLIIEYEDIYGKTHENVYMVNDWYHHKLNDDEIEEINEIWNSYQYSYRIEELDAETVYDIFVAESKSQV
jgi:hypothetical protein